MPKAQVSGSAREAESEHDGGARNRLSGIDRFALCTYRGRISDMNSAHKPGSNSGIDRGIVAIFLLWIVITIALVILAAVRALGDAGSASFVSASNTDVCNRMSI